VITYAWLATQ